MENIFWKKDRSEIGNAELMAYTLAKIRPFEWVRRTMYDENCLYFPPIFCWRFNAAEEQIYSQLKKCVENFKGNVKWIMYKGDERNNQSSRNYTIEPQIFLDLRENTGNNESKFAHRHQEECLKAISDIEPLCKFIEHNFGITNSKPHLPLVPWSDSEDVR